MKRSFLKGKFHSKLLFSYFTFVLLSLISTLLVFRFAQGLLANQLSRNSFLTTVHFRDYVDQSILSASNIGASLSLNDDVIRGGTMSVSPSGYGTVALNNSSIQKLLENETFSNSNLQDVCVVYYQHHTLITSKYSYIDANANNKCQKLFGLEYDAFIEQLSSMRYGGAFIASGDESKHAIAVSYPIINTRTNRISGAVVAILGKSALPSSSEDISFGFQSEKETVLLVDNDELRESLSEYREQDDGDYTLSLDQNDYLLTKLHSDESTLTYYMIQDYTKYNSDLIDMRNTILLVLALISVIGLAIAYLWTKHNYAPVASLVEILSTKRNNNSNERNTVKDNSHEFSIIQQGIQDLVDKQMTDAAILDENKTLIKDYLLKKLLDGNIEDTDSFLDSCKQYDIDLSGIYYYTGVFRINRVDVPKDVRRRNSAAVAKAISDHLSDYFPPQDIISFVNHTDEVVFLLILRANDEHIDSSYVLASVEMGHQKIAEHASRVNYSVNSSISSEYHDIGEIHDAYVEAIDLLDYAELVDIHGRCVSRPYLKSLETDGQSSHAEYLKAERSILNCILSENYIEAGKMISDEIDHYTSLGRQNGKTLRHILNAVVVYLSDIKSTFPDSFYQSLNIEENINAAKTAGEKKAVITKIFTELAEYTSQQKESKRATTKDIKAYIDEHYSDPNLSRDMIASSLGISVSSLSHIIKEDTGETVLDLVSKKRIDEAKKLLSDESNTLQNVAESVGYTNVWTFSRVFKKLTGVSPGSYHVGK